MGADPPPPSREEATGLAGPVRTRRELDDRPPFGSWRVLYAIVLGALGVQIIAYALWSRHYP